MEHFSQKGEVSRPETQIPRNEASGRCAIWDDVLMADPTALGVVEAIERLGSGELTAVELVEACLDRITATDGALEAWTTVDATGALAHARARDADRREGRPPGSLHGIPIGVKDIIDVAGLRTTSGAPAFAHTHPTSDAALVARLGAAGAVIVGKTVATQFAYLDPGPTRNPWALDHTPGGSSSGSAAAVAARHVPAAIGTQTIGSILRPAAYCGVVGLKGEHGAVPLAGVRLLAPSLDHAGVLARSVADAALVESVLLDRPLHVDREVSPPRIAIVEALLDRADGPLRSHLDGVVAALANAGATIVEVTLPSSLDAVLEAGITVLEAEAATEHRELYARNAAAYAPKMAALVEAGLRRTPDEIAAAQRQRAAFRDAVRPWLAGFDALLSPVASGPAPLLGGGTGDPTLCAPWSYASVPSIAIPTGLDADGLPLAIQLTGGTGRIEALLGAAAWCERVVRFDARPPSVGQ
jgi:aspartyl-tRNA(Asn)/glutamyl-tRNA(Gln) amidotransferase subunit A